MKKEINNDTIYNNEDLRKYWLFLIKIYYLQYLLVLLTNGKLAAFHLKNFCHTQTRARPGFKNHPRNQLEPQVDFI